MAVFTNGDQVVQVIGFFGVSVDGEEVMGVELVATIAAFLADVIEFFMDLGGDGSCPGTDRHSVFCDPSFPEVAFCTSTGELFGSFSSSLFLLRSEVEVVGAFESFIPGVGRACFALVELEIVGVNPFFDCFNGTAC